VADTPPTITDEKGVALHFGPSPAKILMPKSSVYPRPNSEGSDLRDDVIKTTYVRSAVDGSSHIVSVWMVDVVINEGPLDAATLRRG
jgi:hypothetical protein